MKFKVGDKVKIVDNTSYHKYPIGSEVTVIMASPGGIYLGSEVGGHRWYFKDRDCEEIPKSTQMEIVDQYYKDKVDNIQKTSDGGPSAYYDFPFTSWKTVNDQMEYLAENKWGKYGIHLKDIFKGLCRWNEKKGTTIEYDTKKIIYYGVRVLRMVVGVKETRKYLQKMLDDPQFSE